MPDVNPIHYKIKLVPDLERFKFSGNTEVLLETERPVREIRLNVLDLAVWSCQVKVDEGFADCSFLMDPKKEEMIISLPDEMEGKICAGRVYGSQPLCGAVHVGLVSI